MRFTLPNHRCSAPASRLPLGRRVSRGLLCLGLIGVASPLVAGPLVARAASEWPMWGGTPARNMVSSETGLVEGGKIASEENEPNPKASQGLAWTVKLGSQTYGNPVVAGGKLYVGTNNGNPRADKYQGDYGALYCLDAKSGALVWQFISPKLPAGRNVDWEECGVCSSAAVDGDRVYFVSNRCEVIALDVAGLANGNDGVQDEAQYVAGEGKDPIEQDKTDADTVWRYDMRHELGVFPHYQTASNPLVVGDRLYVTTSNGVDWSDKHVPAPYAPALICLDKKTGKLLGREKSGISGRTLYCNWSAPTFGEVDGKQTVVFGGGDGWLYGFDPTPAADGTLKELWKIDCNPPEYRKSGDTPLQYRKDPGPSEIIATPVIEKGNIFVAIGQDPEHGSGTGALSCVNVAGGTAKIAWQNKDVGRTMSTVAVKDGLIFVPEIGGMLHCIDAKTGDSLFKHDLEANVWGSALIADNKVYVGNESGELNILGFGKEEMPIAKIDLLGAVFSTPVAAEGMLYVATGDRLFALKK